MQRRRQTASPPPRVVTCAPAHDQSGVRRERPVRVDLRRRMQLRQMDAPGAGRSRLAREGSLSPKCTRLVKRMSEFWFSGPKPANLNLDGKTNHLWIDGPGRMEVLVERDMEGEPLAAPGTCGSTGSSKWTSTAARPSSNGRSWPRSHASARTKVMEVQFQQSIRLDRSQDATAAAKRAVVCDRGVAMESIPSIRNSRGN